MANAFSHSLRILTCAGCGAPVEADVGGGRIRCSYCGVENHLAARDEGRDLAQANQPLAMSEMERMARLRDQESLGDGLPASLRELVDIDGRLLEARADDAKRRWLVTRGELTRTPSFSSSERLFFLTVLLVPHCKPREVRAVLETAIELLPDEGHRYILRCLLARLAVGAGELDAAEEWLAACHPRPLELRMDTAYRLAKATLAAVRGDYPAVLAVLGEDTPLADDFALDCALLRVHALDHEGRHETALDACDRLTASHGADTVKRVLRDMVPRGSGADVYYQSLRRQKAREVAALEKRLRDGRVHGQVGCLTVSIGVPPCCWFFLFPGFETDSAHGLRGPLYGQPASVWGVSLLLAAVLSVFFLAVVIMRSNARAKARLFAELDNARLELQRLDRLPELGRGDRGARIDGRPAR